MRARARGFSLIELMIAVTLGMLAVAAVGSVFIYGSRSYKQDDRVSRMQDELRFAMAQITLDLEMAAFWAQITDPVKNINTTSAVDSWAGCGKLKVDKDGRASGIATLGDVTGTQAAAVFTCLAAAEYVDGSDVIGVKRLQGRMIPDASVGAAFPPEKQDFIYLFSNGVESTLGYHGGTPPATPAVAAGNVFAYEFFPSVWYVRNYTTAGDQVPCLTRKGFAPGGAFTDECMASGIEDMQLEFGMDADTKGGIDRFIEYSGATPPSDTALGTAVAVRVHLLARSAEPDPDSQFRNQKTYQLGSKSVTVNDRYHRRTLSSIVVLRNQGNRLSPYALPSN